MTIQKTKAKLRSNAAGQLLGYSVQQTRLLCRLIQSRTIESINAVSLEVVDDVAVHGEETILEQTKSGLSQNPISDNSIHLWKTISNWIKAIRSGVVGIENTKFVLHVVQPYSGEIAEKINDVAAMENALQLIAELKEKFWGVSPEFKKRAELSSEVGKCINFVLNANTSLLAKLFINFSLEKGSGDSIADARSLIRSCVVAGDASIEPILDGMLGWVKKLTDVQISKGQPAVISVSEFNSQLLACIRTIDRPTTALASIAPEATHEQILNELHRLYIKQLQKIELDSTCQEEAASDYLRAAAARTLWAEVGNVFENEIADFEKKLTKAWNNQRKIMDATDKDKPLELRGQLLYYKCCGMNDVRLHGMDVPSYFIPGSFHALADSVVVGWHPEFEKIFLNISSIASGEGK